MYIPQRTDGAQSNRIQGRWAERLLEAEKLLVSRPFSYRNLENKIKEEVRLWWDVSRWGGIVDNLHPLRKATRMWGNLFVVRSGVVSATGGEQRWQELGRYNHFEFPSREPSKLDGENSRVPKQILRSGINRI